MPADPLLAAFNFDPAKVAQLVVNLLAIAGAFLLGQAITGAAAWGIDRYLTGGKSPLGLKRAARIIGGVILAILVAMIVFGHGEGWIIGGGGGNGDTNRPPSTAGTGNGGTPTTESTPTPIPTHSRPLPASVERIRITLLGGEDVKDERFYLLDDDAAPKSFEDFKTALKTRKEASPKSVGVELRFTKQNTLPMTHPAVQRLTQWAQANGITITFPAETP